MLQIMQETVEDFNPRSREGSDTKLDHRRWDLSNFNPRSREGSDRIQLIHLYCPLLFQSTLPRRERLHCVCRYITKITISIHAPAKGATVYILSCGLWLIYFNPRSREGSDEKAFPHLAKDIISIHAPAKGATSTLFGAFLLVHISIHAPAKGATSPEVLL